MVLPREGGTPLERGGTTTSRNARRPLRTTSTGSRASRDRGEQFELSPAHVHFGRVPVGSTTARVALLTNVSPDLGRFSPRPPDPEGAVPGQVRAGTRLPGARRETQSHVRGDATGRVRRRGHHHHGDAGVRALSVGAGRGMDDAENAENFADGGRPERGDERAFRTRDDVGVRNSIRTSPWTNCARGRDSGEKMKRREIRGEEDEETRDSGEADASSRARSRYPIEYILRSVGSRIPPPRVFTSSCARRVRFPRVSPPRICARTRRRRRRRVRVRLRARAARGRGRAPSETSGHPRDGELSSN